jgi:GNAT superfamily N-acetyltransferase
VYEYHWRANCFLLTYLVVNERARGRGVGVYLVYDAWQRMNALSRSFGYHDGLDTIFMEANDPNAMAPNAPDSMDATERLRTFQHMGIC